MENILITGVSRGIGREFALQYASAGNKVYGVARDISVLGELETAGINLIQGDVTDPLLGEKIRQLIGDERLDICINNAGILPAARVDGFPTDEDLMSSFRTNVVGPMNIVKALLPHVKTDGKFVMLSSSLASIAMADGDYAVAYSVSKAALNMLGRKLQHRLQGQTIILIHPGWVKTDMGGSNASLEIKFSVSSMIETIRKTDHFGFVDYQGGKLAW